LMTSHHHEDVMMTHTVVVTIHLIHTLTVALHMIDHLLVTILHQEMNLMSIAALPAIGMQPQLPVPQTFTNWSFVE
jgi:hypothetical protein